MRPELNATQNNILLAEACRCFSPAIKTMYIRECKSVGTSCRGCLQRGQRRLWSRLLSMQFLQKVWPQGVVTGSKNNLLRTEKRKEKKKNIWLVVMSRVLFVQLQNVWCFIYMGCMCLALTTEKEYSENRFSLLYDYSRQGRGRNALLITPAHWPNAERAFEVWHSEKSQSLSSVVTTFTWEKERDRTPLVKQQLKLWCDLEPPGGCYGKAVCSHSDKHDSSLKWW